MLRDLDPEVQNDLDMRDLTPIGMLIMRDPRGEDNDQTRRRIDAVGGPALEGEPRLIGIAARVFETKARIADRVDRLTRPAS